MLRIFNPEHDMALVADNPHWTSPHAGRQLRQDLGWIPALWSNDGDMVLVDDVDSAEGDYRRLKYSGRKPNITFLTAGQLKTLSSTLDGIDVWGWDRAIRHQLELAGVSHDLLPTDATLDAIRTLSGRQTTLDLMPFLRNGQEDKTCGEVFTARTIDDVRTLLDRYENVVVKSPWSCSGRGVRYLKDCEININQLNWMQNALRQQGELMVEPWHDKMIDFGMEFNIHNGKTEYLGLSLFDTVAGAYTGSILATEEEKMEMLSRYIPTELSQEIQQRICHFMDDRALTFYEGSFGVDMMIVRNGDSDHYLLNPCIELNLRRTMGHTALALSPTLRGNKRIMRIGYEGKHYHLRLFNNEEIYF